MNWPERPTRTVGVYIKLLESIRAWEVGRTTYAGTDSCEGGQIAADILPDRPNRIEPRAVKRRPKSYRRLTQPSAEAKQIEYFING